MFTYTYDDTYAEISRVEKDRSTTPVIRFVFVEADNVPEYNGNQHEVLRLVCFLLDGLAVRDAEGLAPAEWIEIGTGDEDDEPDVYAEGYDAGYADALDHADDEAVEFHHAKSYETGYRDGSAAAFAMVAEEDDGMFDEEDEDELECDIWHRECTLG